MPQVLEICGGAGGQALGLEQAGFEHAAINEIDPDACSTLRANRPGWKVVEGDVRSLDGRAFEGIDLLAGGPPCQPFSVGGHQLGEDDERDLFPEALRLVAEARPRAVMLENVKGLSERKFGEYRVQVLLRLNRLGYVTHWHVVQASDHGVPQLRPRFVLVALRGDDHEFRWPRPSLVRPPGVGDAIGDLMAENGWEGAEAWKQHNATAIAPTLVGGSRKHGGPDLGPTRARQQWLALGVDGRSIANGPPGRGTIIPRLTLRMGARLQGFPDAWQFTGSKTAAWRQIGNAFPPPVAKAVGTEILRFLEG